MRDSAERARPSCSSRVRRQVMLMEEWPAGTLIAMRPSLRGRGAGGRC